MPGATCYYNLLLLLLCVTRVPTAMINITCIYCFNIQVLILSKCPLDLNIVSVPTTGGVCKLVTQSCESQTHHVTLAISWRAGISGCQTGTVAPKSMLKPVYKYPFKCTICESVSCILFGSWPLLHLSVLTYCPEAHGLIHQLVVVTRTSLTVATSALRWHNAALFQILSTCAFSPKVYLSLDWQHVTAEPSEHGASLKMVSELVLASLKSQATAAVFLVSWLMVNLHRLVGWWQTQHFASHKALPCYLSATT